MTSEFLGVGWDFGDSSPKVDDQGQIVLAEYEESIRQAIWMILATAPGERVMRPDFGCGIHELVFAPNNASTWGRVEGEVRQALVQWEPRIDLLDVQVASKPDEPNTLLILIDYRVRTNNNQFNLVYPFYLE